MLFRSDEVFQIHEPAPGCRGSWSNSNPFMQSSLGPSTSIALEKVLSNVKKVHKHTQSTVRRVKEVNQLMEDLETNGPL